MSIRDSFRRGGVFSLSPRECEVAQRLACGETITQIARAMNVSSSAASNYRRHAQEKLGVYNRIQLADAYRTQLAQAYALLSEQMRVRTPRTPATKASSEEANARNHD